MKLVIGIAYIWGKANKGANKYLQSLKIAKHAFSEFLGVIVRKAATTQMAHLVFADSLANAEKPKEPFFCQRTDRNVLTSDCKI